MLPIDQQTILITGATDGVGKALAADLAARGATVLVHGRDDARGERAIADIRHAVPEARLSCVDPALDGTSGVFFNGTKTGRADEQAYDPAARARLRALSDDLCGL